MFTGSSNNLDGWDVEGGFVSGGNCILARQLAFISPTRLYDLVAGSMSEHLTCLELIIPTSDCS